MRNLLAWTVAMGLALSGLACNQSAAPPSAGPEASRTDYRESAGELVDLLVKGDLSAVRARFDERMTAALSEEQLRTAWDQAVQQADAYKQRGEMRRAVEQGYDVVYVPCEFAQGSRDVKVVFNPSGSVGGLWIQ